MMVTTVIGLVCGLIILWAIEMRFNELSNKHKEMQMNILKIKTMLDEMSQKIKYR